MQTELTFNYALQSPCGLYYTGRAGIWWLGPRNEAYTYTVKGAHYKITTEPFKKFKVVRLP